MPGAAKRHSIFLAIGIVLFSLHSLWAGETGCHFLREGGSQNLDADWKTMAIGDYFVVHFDSIAQKPQDESQVVELLNMHKPVLERSKHFLQTELGWKLPATKSELNRPQIFIYLVSSPEEFTGTVRTSPFLHIVLNARLLRTREFPDVWMHHLSHAAQLEYGIRGEYWFHEATAGWMEVEFHGGMAATRKAQQKRLESANVPLNDTDPELALGSSRLLAMFGRPNRDIVRQVWQQKSYSREESVLQVLPRVLALNHLPDLDSYLQNYFLLAVPKLSASKNTTEIVLHPYSAVVLSGTPETISSGGARLSFTPANAEPYSASLLSFAKGESSGTVAMQKGLRRGWSIAVPYAGMDHYKMVLSNSSAKTITGILRKAYDPTIPAVLEYFRVNPGEGGIELEWKTALENGVAFWNLYRLENERKVKLNQFPIPASLQSDGGVRYIYLDPEAGSFYYLEAITGEGFHAPLGSAEKPR